METKSYTTRSCASCEAHDATASSLSLNFPDGEAFVSFPPRVSMAEMIRRNQQLRRWFPHGLRRAEERWQAKTALEFHL